MTCYVFNSLSRRYYILDPKDALIGTMNQNGYPLLLNYDGS